MKENALKEINRLTEIIDELREKCPWDKKQTMHSLSNLTIEETYELIQSIVDKDIQGIKEELGDLLVHIIFYSKIASEKNQFNLSDVVSNVIEKLIRRHPHIYGNVSVSGEEDVKKNWEKIKLKETGKTSVLSGVPLSLPAINKAFRIQSKVSQIGFDWPKAHLVRDKIREELSELDKAILSEDTDEVMHEMGDVFFSLINYARYLNIDPEMALEKTNRKFISRFDYVENKIREQQRDITTVPPKEMDALWKEAKKKEGKKYE